MTKPLLLPNGSPSKLDDQAPEGTVWLDKTITYTENNEQVRFTPKDVLKAAARMLRDGKSLDHILVELDIKGIVSHKTLERAIRNLGMPLLEADIAAGREPEESLVLIDSALAPLRLDEDDELSSG